MVDKGLEEKTELTEEEFAKAIKTSDNLDLTNEEIHLMYARMMRYRKANLKVRGKLIKLVTAAVLPLMVFTIDSIQYLATTHYLNSVERKEGIEAAKDKANDLIAQNKTFMDYVLFGGIELGARYHLSNK